MLHPDHSLNQPHSWNPAVYDAVRPSAPATQGKTLSADAAVPLSFPRGLLAFPEAQTLLLRPLGDRRLPQVLLLHGYAPDAPRFLVMGPRAAGAILPSAEACMTRRRCQVALEDACWFLIVTVDWDGETPDFHVNYRAPLLIDSRRRLGWQRVLADEVQPRRGILFHA